MQVWRGTAYKAQLNLNIINSINPSDSFQLLFFKAVGHKHFSNKHYVKHAVISNINVGSKILALFL